MSKPTLLMLNMSHQFDWDKGIVNRNYHVLNALIHSGEYEKVISVDFFPFTFKKRIKMILKGKLWKRNTTTVYKKWHTRVDTDPTNGSVYRVTSLSEKHLPQMLQRLNIDTTNFVLWSYNPLAIDLMAIYKNAFVVFDAVDNWTEHPSYTSVTDRLQENYKTIAKRADIIFTVSEGLIDFFGKKQKVMYVPNGVDAEHFVTGTCNPSLLGKKSLDTSKKTVGYHGIIQSRVNLSVFDYLAKKFPEMNFVIAGPVWKEMQTEMKELQQLPNVYTPGPVPYAQLPSLLHCFDVTVIPHKVDAFTQSMNPLKIYEYLASGKPIISTAVAGADQFQDLIKLAVSPEDFAEKIVKAIETDTTELISRRQEMAKQHNWSTRVQLMLDLMTTSQEEHDDDHGKN